MYTSSKMFRILPRLLGFALALAALVQPALGDPADNPEKRRAMVEKIAEMGVRDERVLEVMKKVPRHEFVPANLVEQAYEDGPLPIGEGQTISQPYVVAYMTELLRLGPGHRVLEIGTGSGYQAAVLAELAGEIYTIEIIPELGKRAAATFERLGYDNVYSRIGDGYQGWPEAAPFDAIIVTAAAPRVPEPLIEQLADGGRMVIPVGRHGQDVTLVTKRGDRIDRQRLLPVIFVPMTGEVEKPPKR